MESSLMRNERKDRKQLVAREKNGRVQELAVFMRGKAGEKE